MAISKDKKQSSAEEIDQPKTSVQSRRSVLKALAGVPVLGFFGWEVLKNSKAASTKKNRVIKELGLESLEMPVALKSPTGNSGNLLRIGMIGFGNRAHDLAKGLGFMHPEDVEAKKKDKSLAGWMEQEYLNVALVGICDVYDVHAERGLATAHNDIRPGGEKAMKLPVKRYTTYHDLLADKDIDAVVIATPDHHHAIISTEAAKAGKHVYCEKSVALEEDELNGLYNTVKNSKIVFQLGHQITQNVVFQQAKEIVKKDILGKITLVETTTNRNTAEGAWIRHLDANGNPKPGDEKTIDWKQWLGTRPYVPFSVDRYYSWVKWFAYDLGMIGQLFTHEFDAVNQLLRIGIPKSVVSSGGIYYWKDNREIPDVLHCVFEYPERDLTLIYSANLACSRDRGRVFMGHDASMELGESLSIKADFDSTRYKKKIEEGIIDTSVPMIAIHPGSGKVDAVTSATEKYYASRGLTTTNINGREVDVTHLHLKQWIDCIRNGGTPTANIDRAFEEGIACLMAHRSYIEKRRVEWDPVNRKIV
jgi:predicted dehydrogenase